MELAGSLTNIQKVALRGEVAYAVSTASHDAEIKLRIYAILKEIEEEYKPFLIQAFKEAVTFDEEIVDKLYFETLSTDVPVWLWIEKAMADMKEALHLAEASSILRVSIDKKKERRHIIESAFLSFGREALMISADAAEQLFVTILEDYDLSFLRTTCFYLLSCCEEVRDSGTVQDKIPENLMECQFDLRNTLSLRIETEALKMFNKTRQTYKPKEKKIKTERIEINSDMTEEEISEFLSKKILESFKGITKFNKEPKYKYVVNKVFNNTQITTSIRTCNSRKEAEEFIEQIKREYPELQTSCKFFISKEKENGDR